MGKMLDRVIRVAYAQREDGDRRDERLSPYARRPERHNSDHSIFASPIYASHPKRKSTNYGIVASPVHERDHSRSPVRHLGRAERAINNHTHSP